MRWFPLLLLLSLAACEGAILGERGVDLPAVLVPPEVTPQEEPLPPFAPAPLRARLLIASQYRNAIADLLGPEAAAAASPPARAAAPAPAGAPLAPAPAYRPTPTAPRTTRPTRQPATATSTSCERA